MDMQTRCDISRTVKIEVKLLLSANRKSYMPCGLAQQRMTLSDLEWPFYTLHSISAVAELLVINISCITLSKLCLRRAALAIF